jgi:cytochrome b561
MTQGLRYDGVTITLHWLSAVLIGALWCIGQTIDFVPRGPWRVDYRSLHMTLGVLLVAVYVARVIWRLSSGDRLPPEANVWLAGIARLVHWVLYLLIPTVLVLGLLNVWVRGDAVFNLFTVPRLSPGNKALREWIGDWHALGANTILVVAGLHAAAALMHHFVLRDGVLRRMLPLR